MPKTEFTDFDSEILSQIIQNCKSNQLRRRALRESDKTLNDIIQLGRAMELSDSQAQAMERPETVNRVSKTFPRPKPRSINNPRNSDQRHKVKSNRDQNNHRKDRCFNCGGQYPHRDKPCPAKNKVCHNCKKTGHFKKMCRGKKTEPVKTVNEYSDSDSDSYCYGVRLENNVNAMKGPFVNVRLNDRSVKLLVSTVVRP